MVPLYTPLRLEAPLDLPVAPLQLGGINAYLRDAYPGAYRAMGPIRRWLDRPDLITWSAQFAVRTKASDLGALTVGFLKGPDGPHREEMEALAATVAELHPDVILIANALLLGLAPALRQLNPNSALLCQIQGEDGFIDELPEPWQAQTVDLIQKHVALIDRFVAPCVTYAHKFAPTLKIPAEDISIVPPALGMQAPADKQPRERLVVGHLSSLRRVKGFDLLLEAVGRLKHRKKLDVQLVTAGRNLEQGFADVINYNTRDFNLIENVTNLGEIPPSEKAAFFARCDVICLPSRLCESRGMVALEALAHGVPVVASRRGIFLELEALGIGLTTTDDNPESLAEAILAAKGRTVHPEVVAERFSKQASAIAAEACFEGALSSRR